MLLYTVKNKSFGVAAILASWVLSCSLAIGQNVPKAIPASGQPVHSTEVNATARQAIGEDRSIRGLEDRLVSLQNSIDRLSMKGDERNYWTMRDIPSLIAATVAVLSVLISYLVMQQNKNMTIRQLRKRADEERAKTLQEKLDKFYGPLIQLRETSKLLYRVFTSRQKDPEKFRTLTALLAGEEFVGNDKILLDQINQQPPAEPVV